MKNLNELKAGDTLTRSDGTKHEIINIGYQKEFLSEPVKYFYFTGFCVSEICLVKMFKNLYEEK
jgi:hypothetical protein